MARHDGELDDARDQRADGRAAYAHFRRAEMAGDEQIVDRHIDDQRHDRHAQRDANRLGDAHRAQHDGGRGEEQIAEADDGEILDALRGDGGGIGEQRQRGVREEAHRGEEQQRDEQPRAQADRGQTAHLAHALLSPVLAAQHDHGVADGIDQLLEHELDLIDRGHAGERRLGIGAEHQVVGQIDAEYDGLLEHQRDAQAQEGLIERFVADQHGKNSVSDVHFAAY